jgi:hypothetical protein
MVSRYDFYTQQLTVASACDKTYCYTDYMSLLSAIETIHRRVTEWLVNNESEGMWKETVMT